MYLVSLPADAASLGAGAGNPGTHICFFRFFLCFATIFSFLSGIKSTHFATCVGDKARSGRFVLIFKVETTSGT